MDQANKKTACLPSTILYIPYQTLRCKQASRVCAHIICILETIDLARMSKNFLRTFHMLRYAHLTLQLTALFGCWWWHQPMLMRPVNIIVRERSYANGYWLRSHKTDDRVHYPSGATPVTRDWGWHAAPTYAHGRLAYSAALAMPALPCQHYHNCYCCLQNAIETSGISLVSKNRSMHVCWPASMQRTCKKAGLLHS